MKKKISGGLFFVLLSLIACQGDSSLISCDNNDGTSLINATTRGEAGDGKYDVLGHGYDITNQYLDPNASRAIVLDISKLEVDNLIQPYNLGKADARYVSGKDVYEFTSNMSTSIKIDEPGFVKAIAGGSLNVAFGGNNSYSSDYSFAYFNQKYVDSRYRITEVDLEVLRGYLTPQFINRVSTYTPAQIVEMYGTHVLKDIYVGAKLEVYLMAKSTNTSKKQNVDASMGVSLAKIFNIEAKFHYDSSLATNNREQSLYYSTVGGDPFVGLLGTLDPEKAPTVDLSKWSATIKNTTPKFIDVDNSIQSFIPIYELVADPVKSQALKTYINSYVRSKELKSVTLYPTSSGLRTISGLGHVNAGGGVAIGDIDGNGKPDMVLMGVDDPAGVNSFWYRILFDLDENGFSSRQSGVYSIPAVGHDNSGGGVAISDLNKNGKPDLILLCADKPAKGPAGLCYRVVYDLNIDGSYTSVSSIKSTPVMGDCYDGADIDICDINGNGILDLLLMTYDDPEEMNNFRYQIAYDLSSFGNYQSLSPLYGISGVGHMGEGAGVAVGDIDRNGTLDIIFMALDAPEGSANRFVYRVLPDIDKYGASYSPLSDAFWLPTSLSPCQRGGGAGCCLYDIDNNGFLDVVFVAINNDVLGRNNTWKYVTGYNLNKQYIPMQWR